MKHILIAASLLVGITSYADSANDKTVPILEFHTVAPTIYRGARPGYAGLKAIKDLGVKTILNIDDDVVAIDEEVQNIRGTGMNMISLPMSGFWTPDDDQVTQILATLTNPANQPVFIHCQHGQDRTGLIIGLYRVFYEKWTPQAAYDEMLDKNFHPLLFMLDSYFKQKTNY